MKHSLFEPLRKVSEIILPFILAQTVPLLRYERFNDYLFQNGNFNIFTFIGEENYFLIQYSQG